MPDDSTPPSGLPPIAKRLTWVVTAARALIVGLLMADGAALIDVPASDVLLIGVLGGLGATAYILMFAVKGRAGGVCPQVSVIDARTSLCSS
jgi:hypothetical protein